MAGGRGLSGRECFESGEGGRVGQWSWQVKCDYSQGRLHTFCMAMALPGSPTVALMLLRFRLSPCLARDCFKADVSLRGAKVAAGRRKQLATSPEVGW